jgi:hypothetical protein
MSYVTRHTPHVITHQTLTGKTSARVLEGLPSLTPSTTSRGEIFAAMFRSKRTAALLLLMMLLLLLMVMLMQVMVARTAKTAMQVMAARPEYLKAREIRPGHCGQDAVGCCENY